MLKLSGLLKGTMIVTLVGSALGTVALTGALANEARTKAAVATGTSGDTLSQMSDHALQSKWRSDLSRLGFGENVVSHVEKALVRQGLDRDSQLFKELDALLKSADRLFGKAQAVVAGHAGFDASGIVTDRAQAVRSIQTLGADLHALRSKIVLRPEQLIG